MSQAWTRMKLGDVLRRSNESLQLRPDQEYKEVTVRLWGNGAVERRRILGVEIAGTRRLVARAGQFIVSRIDARNGAMAIVPADLDGAVVSNDFPLFDVDSSQLLPEFLRWLSRSQRFIELCTKASEGTTNRIRLKEVRLLDFEIALPSVADQRRIVAKMEALTPLCRRADEISGDVTRLVPALIPSYLNREVHTLACRCKLKPIGEFLKRRRQVVALDRARMYSGLGTRMWGRGVYVHELRRGDSFEAERYSVHVNQLIYNEVWAHNGAIGVVPRFVGETVVSRHFHVFDVDWAEIVPAYLQAIFQSPWFWSCCQAGTVSTTGRGHLRRSHFSAIEIPIPSRDEQTKFLEAFQELQSQEQLLRESRGQTKAAIGAMVDAVVNQTLEAAIPP